MMSLVLVIVGAAVGAPLRYLTDRAVQARNDTVFPWGHVFRQCDRQSHSGAAQWRGRRRCRPQLLELLLGVGFCGALTTYSTFSYETLRLIEQGAVFYAVANVVISVTAALGAAFTGAAIAQAIWP